jgi:hypothetical protein
MNNHPFNLIVRFLLEIALLIIFTYWGLNKFSGLSKYIVGIGLPIIIATLWAIFRVEGDPGKAIIAIPGWLRLLYEVILFVSAAYLLFQLQMNTLAYVFIVISVIHYLASYERIIWLLRS